MILIVFVRFAIIFWFQVITNISKKGVDLINKVICKVILFSLNVDILISTLFFTQLQKLINIFAGEIAKA